MSFRVYCSIPNQTHNRDGILMEVTNILCNFSKEHNHLEPITLDYRLGHLSFDSNDVSKADVVLLMHQNGKFDFDIDSLTNDSKKDYQLAKELGKKVFLLYRTRDGKLYTYAMNSGTQHLSGISGTTEWFKFHLTKSVPDKKKGDHIDAVNYAIQGHIAQIGEQVDTSQYYDGGYTSNAPTPPTKYIKTSGIVKPMYDRRLLI